MKSILINLKEETANEINRLINYEFNNINFHSPKNQTDFIREAIENYILLIQEEIENIKKKTLFELKKDLKED